MERKRSLTVNLRSIMIYLISNLEKVRAPSRFLIRKRLVGGVWGRIAPLASWSPRRRRNERQDINTSDKIEIAHFEG